MTDIIDLVNDSHRRIRRLAEALSDTARFAGAGRCGGLASTWNRLAGLAEAHVLAAQEVCWPAMTDGSPRARAVAAGLAADAGDLREAIATARLHPAGSRCWWLAVSDALRHYAALAGREEHDLLPGFAAHSTPELRGQLGHQWQAALATADGQALLPTHWV